MTLGDICKICYCSSEESGLPLLSPCRCDGSIKFVDQACLLRWMESSGKKSCELCKQIITVEDKLEKFHPTDNAQWCKDFFKKSVTALLYRIIAVQCFMWWTWRMTNMDCGTDELIMSLVVSSALVLLISWPCQSIDVLGSMWCLMWFLMWCLNMECLMDGIMSVVSMSALYLLWTEDISTQDLAQDE